MRCISNSHKKPLVVAHESLSRFARPTRFAPLVVKLHGDAHLAPKNTAEETSTLHASLQQVLRNLLNDSGLIFCGYGGNDKSILEALQNLPSDALPGGVFWVGSKLPENGFKAWLESRNAVWIEHRDFDELMLYFRTEFELDMPTEARFGEIFAAFRATFEKLSGKATKAAENEISEDDHAFQIAIENIRTSVKDWWGVQLEANQFEESDPEKANQIYLSGLEKFPYSPELLGNYALFLVEPRKDYDQAKRYFESALRIDPKQVNTLSSHAFFLHVIRKDYDQAERHYQRTLEVDPKHVITLGNYAWFLHESRKNYDEAERYYRRALESDPNYVIVLGNYAWFLHVIRKDYDQAENYYQRALDFDPNYGNALVNYAGFVLARGRENDGWKLLDRSNNVEVDLVAKLERQFYIYAHRNDKQARNNALQTIKRDLFDGIRSGHFDLSWNVDRAIADGHPEPEFITQFAKVVSDEAKIETLDGFVVWKN